MTERQKDKQREKEGERKKERRRERREEGKGGREGREAGREGGRHGEYFLLLLIILADYCVPATCKDIRKYQCKTSSKERIKAP